MMGICVVGRIVVEMVIGCTERRKARDRKFVDLEGVFSIALRLTGRTQTVEL